MPGILCCCGRGEPDTMEEQVRKSIHRTAKSTKSRPRFSYLEYSKEAAKSGTPRSQSGESPGSHAFGGLGGDGLTRENPLFRASLDMDNGGPDLSSEHHGSGINGHANPPEDLDLNGFGDEEEEFNGFEEVGEPRLVRRPTTASRTSVASVESSLFYGLPVASVNSVSPAPDDDRGPSPFAVASALAGETIAGDGIENLVFSADLPRPVSRVSKGKSKRLSRARDSTYADLVLSPPYINRKLLETYMFTVADFDELDGKAVKNHLEAAETVFAQLDEGGRGEVELRAVVSVIAGSNADPAQIEEIKSAFSTADEDHSGTLRYREFANFILIREGFLSAPILDSAEPTLRADGSLDIPDTSQHGSAQALKELAVSCPGMFRKQGRGEVRVSAIAEVTPKGFHLEIEVEEAVHLAAPVNVLDISLVCSETKRRHHHTAKFSATQHPREHVKVDWDVSSVHANGGTVVIRFHRGSRKDAALGAVSFPVSDVVSDDVPTGGWFHLLPEPAGSSQHFRCATVPGPSKSAPNVPPNQLENLRLREPGHSLLPPHSLLDVKLTRVLGEGTYGKVVLAVDGQDSSFAIKGMSKAVAIEKEEVEQIMIERKVLIQFRHPFVIRLLSTFETRQNIFFCMEPLLGGSMVDHAGKPMSATAVSFYGAEILLGLWHLHDCGVIYRDLKLENVLLDIAGHVRLADFGLAKILDSNQNQAHTFCGTPEYVAPEMLAGSPYGRSVDFWSLGVLLFRLRTGSFPFRRDETDEPDVIYRAVRTTSTVVLPTNVDSASVRTIQGLLKQDVKTRLGCDMQRGAEDLRAAPLFSRVNWAQLSRRGKNPPLKPTPQRLSMTALDSDTVGEEVFTLDDAPKSTISDIDQTKFAGFSWSQDIERDELLGLRSSTR